jgi:hypothetical protein
MPGRCRSGCGMRLSQPRGSTLCWLHRSQRYRHLPETVPETIRPAYTARQFTSVAAILARFRNDHTVRTQCGTACVYSVTPRTQQSPLAGHGCERAMLEELLAARGPLKPHGNALHLLLPRALTPQERALRLICPARPCKRTVGPTRAAGTAAAARGDYVPSARCPDRAARARVTAR